MKKNNIIDYEKLYNRPNIEGVGENTKDIIEEEDKEIVESGEKIYSLIQAVLNKTPYN